MAKGKQLRIRDADKHQTHGSAAIKYRLLQLRGTRMVSDYLKGMSLEAMAKKYNVGISTVKRSLTLAAGADGGKLIEQIEKQERQIIDQLVPKALKIYNDKLDEGDPYVAKDVVDKLVKLGNRLAAKEQHQQALTVDSYFKQKRLENETASQIKHISGDIIEAQGDGNEPFSEGSPGFGTDVDEIRAFEDEELDPLAGFGEDLQQTEDEDQ